MAEPIPAQKAPYNVTVEEGKRYFWCACGRSSNQPFCDGSHKDTGITPMLFTAEKTEELWFCGCKRPAASPSATELTTRSDRDPGGRLQPGRPAPAARHAAAIRPGRAR